MNSVIRSVVRARSVRIFARPLINNKVSRDLYVIDVAIIKPPIPSDATLASKQNKCTDNMHCPMRTMKYPVGFRQSNGSLQNKLVGEKESFFFR